MHNILIYESSKGDRFLLGKDGIVVTDTELLDYEWTAAAVNERISVFNKKMVEKPLTVVFYKNPQELANKFNRIVEHDVVNMTPGKFYLCPYEKNITDSLSDCYYIKGYISASRKPAFKVGSHIELELTFLTDEPTWVKDVVSQFRYNNDEESEFLDYPYDYMYDYFFGGNTKFLVNDGTIKSDFKIIVYGKENSPNVDIMIGGNRYVLFAVAKANEYITIDSKNKKITKTDARGRVTNLFTYRSRSSDIFKKIPVGNSLVTWSGELDFDIVLYQERSEPLWI